MKDSSLLVAVAEKIKNLAWLLFITAKVKIFNVGQEADITETAFLLYCVMVKVVKAMPAGVTCEVYRACGG